MLVERGRLFATIYFCSVCQSPRKTKMSERSVADPPMAVFSTGCLIGMMLSYGNITGFLAGLVAGVFIQTNGPHIGGSIMSCATFVTEASVSVVRSLGQYSRGVAVEEERRPDERK